MALYSLEFFVEGVEVEVLDQMRRNLVFNVKVTCSDFIHFSIEYIYKNSAYNVMKGSGNGKAVVFSTTTEKLIPSFTNDFQAQVSDDEDNGEIGTCKISWMNDFDQQVKNFGKSAIKFIQHTNNYKLNNAAGKSVGTLKVTMCLVWHGENIEIPISFLGSQINIPLTFRRKTFGHHQSSTNDNWKPLFFGQTKQAKSLMEPGMEIYAQFAGIPVQPPMSTLLTPDYINEHLCGHKTCPGAQKFKEYGLGPLAPAGSGLGTVSAINAKPLGLYGMSQAYGTLDGYGAYGMFVKKTNKPKTCCGSPDCPYTIFYGKPDPKPSIEELDERPKKCQCKNCRKNNESNASSKQSSKGSTCGSPKCPKNIPKEQVNCPFLNKPPSSCCSKPPSKPKDVTCPFQPKPPKEVTCPIRSPRQSAGADRYNSECPETCPYSTARQRRQSSNGNKQRYGSCGGNVCPLDTNSSNNHAWAYDDMAFSFDERSGSHGTKNCKDRDCLFYKDSNDESLSKGFLSDKPLGLISEADPEEIDEECPDTCQFFPSARRKPVSKNCRDKDCPYYKIDPEEEEEIGPCGGRICPLDRDGDYRSSAGKQKRLSLLVNEDGKKILLSGNGDSKSVEFSKNILGTISAGDPSDMYMLISRLVGERPRTTSLNNYFSPSSQNVIDSIKERQNRKGPCSKNSCRAAKYKTCSECGGVSRSGVTCNNTDVSFTSVSYDDSFATTEVQDTSQKIEKPEVKPDVKPAQSALKKKVPPTPTKDKMVVKIVKPRKIRTRFVYNEGEAYPGIRLGHKKCSTGAKNVPAHMGWLWNIKGDWERKRRIGYKPGKVSKTVEERIIQNRRKKGIPDPPELTMLVKKKKFKINQEESDSDEDEEVVPKPTLTIEKKDGNYLITMNPLKDPKTLACNENPYMRCKPMQFLIIKPKKETPAPVLARYTEYDGEDEGEEDYSNYYNGCLCDEEKVCSSSSSESELNIEFTTPAGLITPERMKKMINVVNVENQFKEADFHCPDCTKIIPTIYKKEKKKRKV